MRKDGFKFTTLLFLLCCIASWAQAGEEVLIFSEQRVVLQAASEVQQRRAIADALEQVLKRASGLDVLPRHAALIQAQRDPMPLLRSFELADSDILLPNAIGNLEPTNKLQLVFDNKGVLDLLAAMNLPYWGSPRPQTLVVIAAPQGEIVDVVTDWSAAPVVADVIAMAAAQGLPLIWPELNLDELLLLHPDDLWLGLQQPLQTMAERYSAKLVLGGHIDYDVAQEQWIGRWQLVDKQLHLLQVVSGASIAEVVAPAMAWLREYLSAQYAIAAAGDVFEYRLRVSLVDNLSAQNQMSRYLMGLPGAQGVQVEQIEGASISLRFATRASAEQWLAWLALDNRLIPTQPISVDVQWMEFEWHG